MVNKTFLNPNPIILVSLWPYFYEKNNKIPLSGHKCGRYCLFQLEKCLILIISLCFPIKVMSKSLLLRHHN